MEGAYSLLVLDEKDGITAFASVENDFGEEWKDPYLPELREYTPEETTIKPTGYIEGLSDEDKEKMKSIADGFGVHVTQLLNPAYGVTTEDWRFVWQQRTLYYVGKWMGSFFPLQWDLKIQNKFFWYNKNSKEAEEIMDKLATEIMITEETTRVPKILMCRTTATQTPSKFVMSILGIKHYLVQEFHRNYVCYLLQVMPYDYIVLRKEDGSPYLLEKEKWTFKKGVEFFFDVKDKFFMELLGLRYFSIYESVTFGEGEETTRVPYEKTTVFSSKLKSAYDDVLVSSSIEEHEEQHDDEELLFF